MKTKNLTISKNLIIILFFLINLLFTNSFGNNYYQNDKDQNKNLNQDIKDTLNYFINLFYLYNPYIKNYEYLVNANIYNAKSFIYLKSFEYGISLSNIPYKYLLPNKNEPMTSYTLMYSIITPNKNKINTNINYTLKQNEIIQYEKLTYLLISSYELKKNIINIYFLNNQKQILNNIKKDFFKLKDLTLIDYTYNKSKLSDILLIDKEIYSLETEINTLNTEINTNIQNLYSLVPINNLENIIKNKLEGINYNPSLNLDSLINTISTVNIRQYLYTNPFLLKIKKEKELLYYEIYKEKASPLSDNKLSIEYSIRPNLDHMLMLKYSIMFEDKNISINKIQAINQKINSIEYEYQNEFIKYQANYYYILSQLKLLKILLTNLENEKQKQKQYIDSLLLEYTYNKSKILDIYLAYKQLLDIELKENDLKKQLSHLIIELQLLKGEIEYEYQ